MSLPPRLRYPPNIYRSTAEKAQRIVEDDAAWADEHHGKVRYDGRCYRAVCSCMWIGESRPTRVEADADAAKHRAGLESSKDSDPTPQAIA